MQKQEQPTIAIDFDGVVHSYKTGWTGNTPNDPPVPGALEFINWLIEKGFKVIIHTTRGRTAQGIIAVLKWLEENGFPDLEVTNDKPKAKLYIDDRAYRFEGSFTKVSEYILHNPELGVWYRKD